MRSRLLGGSLVAVVLAGGILSQVYSDMCYWLPWAIECWIFGY